LGAASLRDARDRRARRRRVVRRPSGRSRCAWWNASARDDGTREDDARGATGRVERDGGGWTIRAGGTTATTTTTRRAT